MLKILKKKSALPTKKYRYRRSIITVKENTLMFLIKEMLMKKISAIIKFCIVGLFSEIPIPTCFRHFDKNKLFLQKMFL